MNLLNSFFGLTPPSLFCARIFSPPFPSFASGENSSANISLNSPLFFDINTLTFSISSLLNDATSSSSITLVISALTSSCLNCFCCSSCCCCCCLNSCWCFIIAGEACSSISICLAWFKNDARNCSSINAALSAGSISLSIPPAPSTTCKNGFVDSRWACGAGIGTSCPYPYAPPPPPFSASP
uniref:(northern house mosquito) hypothetical protein n=1 Tax=Culex pipiens TaxID=7175 RepID=A0A8D8BJE9_CULPI